ncbi:sulfotransferase family protein [Rubrobacter marinus]|uniref:sulfotransferase family protein n=1 Tax=Rubrobacter marinus TaxID=2653852 RepID=UPI00140CF234|nr:sulfotransferase [Rubrobacter marinus]
MRKASRGLDLAGSYLRSSFEGRRNRELFAGVETYCMFVGYPKSGHSLFGSLLDAHPEAIIAHEQDALRYLQNGFGRTQLFHLLLENSRRYGEAGRDWNVYSYRVPGQWQGRFRRLRVIGDKKGALSTLRLDRNPGLQEKLRRVAGVPVKYVHVVRNPYDNISTMLRDGVFDWKSGGRGRDLKRNIEDYFALCEAMRRFVERTDPSEVFEVRHEEIVSDPERELRRLCASLDLEASEDYLRDCSGMVFRAPSRSREKVEWTPEDVEYVRRRSEEFGFLRGYSYED